MVTFFSSLLIEISLLASAYTNNLAFFGEIRTGGYIGAFLILIKQL